jgi:hypothetical protein
MAVLLAWPAMAAETAESCREYLQDREMAEFPEQQQAYDACMKRVRQPPVKLNTYVWQCNDIRLTITERPEGTYYDLGGSIWGGSQFLFTLGPAYEPKLFMNGRPCIRLR